MFPFCLKLRQLLWVAVRGLKAFRQKQARLSEKKHGVFPVTQHIPFHSPQKKADHCFLCSCFNYFELEWSFTVKYIFLKTQLNVTSNLFYKASRAHAWAPHTSIFFCTAAGWPVSSTDGLLSDLDCLVLAYAFVHVWLSSSLSIFVSLDP